MNARDFLFWSSQDSSTFSDLQFFINLVTHHCCDMIVTNLPSVPIPYLRDTKKKHDEKQNYVKAFKLLLMEKRIFNSSGSTLKITHFELLCRSRLTMWRQGEKKRCVEIEALKILFEHRRMQQRRWCVKSEKPLNLTSKLIHSSSSVKLFN